VACVSVKTRIIHTNVRRPVQRTPRPQNLHSDSDLQIRQLCGVRGRGGAGGGAAGRTPERKFKKLRIRAWPEPHSQRPGLKLGRQAEQTRLSGHTSFGDQGLNAKGQGREVLEPSNCSKGSMCSSGDGTPVLNQPPQNFHNSLSMFKINNRKRKGRGTGPCNHPAKRAGVQYTSVLRPLVVLTLDEKRARNVLCRSVK